MKLEVGERVVIASGTHPVLDQDFHGKVSKIFPDRIVIALDPPDNNQTITILRLLPEGDEECTLQ